MLRNVVSLLIASSVTFAATDRDAAEWTIRKGGRVMVNDSRAPIASLSELPKGELRVTGVDLSGTVLDPKELSHLEGLEHVRELFLPGSAFTPGAGSKLEGNADLKVIAGMKQLERLQFSLHFLPYFNVTDAGFATFAGITNLKELRCAQCRIEKRGLDPFVNLESLDLSYSTFGNTAMASLAGMHNLKRLYLRDTSITDEGLRHLAGLTHLEELDLYGVKITDRGMAALKDLKELRKLNLLGAPITDESIPILAGMTHLRELNVYRSRISNAGLARLNGLRDLSSIDVRYTRVTGAGVDSLRAALPQCEIEFAGAAPARVEVKAAKPRGPGDKALAEWIAAMGGKAAMTAGKLREVSLAGTHVADAQLASLAAGTGITKLNLQATEISDLGLQHLQSLKGLQELDLGYTAVSDAGLANLPPLRVLRVNGTQVAATGALPKSLVELDLTACPVTDNGAKQLARLTALERLSLSGTDISDAAAVDLATLPALKALNLNSTDIGDKGLRSLSAMTNLQALELNYGRFSDKGLDALKPLVNLKRLDLVRTRAGNLGAAAIATLRALEELNLDYTAIDAKGFASFNAMPNLRELHLDSLEVGDESVDVLRSMPNLQSVNLYHTLLTEGGAKRLKDAMPKTQIIWDRDSARPNRRKT